MPAARSNKLCSQRDFNLWRIPLQLSLAAVALFAITMIPDVLDKFGVIHIASWLTMGSIDDARAILSAMMGAVATVLALIFSVALLVLSMVSTLFGQRLLYRFLQDWVTQVTIVWMLSVRIERLTKLAFDQIRQAAATTPAVLIRQLEAIRRLAPRLPYACRQTLSDQADAIFLLIADRPFVGIPEDRGFASCGVIQNSCSRKSLGRVVGFSEKCCARIAYGSRTHQKLHGALSSGLLSPKLYL